MKASRSLVIGALAALALVLATVAPAGAMMTPAQKQLKSDQKALAHELHVLAVDEEKFPQLDAREAARIERHIATGAKDEAKAAALDEKIAKLEEASMPNLEKIERLVAMRAGLAKAIVKLRQIVALEEAAHLENEAARTASLAKIHAAIHHLEAAILLDEKEVEEGL